MAPPHMVVFSLDTTGSQRHNSRQRSFFRWVRRALANFVAALRRWGRKTMQYLPGFTVQCINAQCDLRGHWLRADATGLIIDSGRCPSCGDVLRNVPPPLSPRFRMRPRALTARPPLRPRPR
jgi:hypothetical protein